MHKYQIEIRVQDAVGLKESASVAGGGILTRCALSSYMTGHGEIYSQFLAVYKNSYHHSIRLGHAQAERLRYCLILIDQAQIDINENEQVNSLLPELMSPQMEELIMEFDLNFWTKAIYQVLDKLDDSFEKQDLVDRLQNISWVGIDVDSQSSFGDLQSILCELNILYLTADVLALGAQVGE